MEQTKILKRAWQILWQYKALWIFGMILALTTASFSQGSTQWNNGGDDQRFEGTRVEINPDEPIYPQIRKAFEEEFERDLRDLDRLFNGDLNFDAGRIFRIITTLLTISLVLFILFRIGCYVAETALIKMVNDHEESGEKLKIRQGFRLGWSLASWRLFLIELTINVPTFLFFVAVFAVAFSPIYPMVFGNGEESILAVVSTIGLFFIAVLLAIVVGAGLHLVKPLIRRVCVLGDVGVIDSIRQGFTLVRENLKDTGLLWLIMIGIDLLWAIVILPVALVLIPIGILLGLGISLLLDTLSFITWDTPFLIAAAGLPIFIFVIAVPLIFLGGLRETFQSSSWTLAYRELKALRSIKD